jgi:hypothetical protein
VGSGEPRLAEIERRIDRSTERSAAAREDSRARIEPRLRSLRDEVRLHASLDAMEADVSIVEALLDLDDADGADAFVSAAREVLRAYRTRLDVLRVGSGGSERSPAIGAAEGRITVATERLDGFERVATPPGASRTKVLVALDDLDRTCRAAIDAAGEGTDAT